MGRRFLPTLLAALAVAGAVPALAAEPGGDPGELRAVVVEDAPDAVEVWIALPPTVDPGSVEVQLAGRLVVVRARDEAGRTVRSAPLHLREPVVEEGATARYEGAWLAITLRKAAAGPGY
jgi:HSP20 family molecular chaperone IbpA